MERRMFRDKSLDYAELTQQIDSWARKYPGHVRVTSLGASAEGRAIPLLTIGRDPDVPRPAIWVDGNMHATELCGSSVALAIAEDVIAIHEGKLESAGVHPGSSVARGRGDGRVPPHMEAAIRDPLFYILPRIPPHRPQAV